MAYPTPHDTAPGDHVPPDEPIVTHFQLTREELLGAARWMLFRNPRAYRLAVFGAILALGGSLASIVLHDPAGERVLVLGVIDLLLWSVFMAVVPRWAVRKSASAAGPQSVAFSDLGVQARSTLAEARSSWSLYPASFESGGCYLLRTGARRAPLVVPKRALASSSDEERLRDLLARHTAARLRPRAEA